MRPAWKPGHSALRKGRYSQSGGIYSITFVTDRRIPWFQDLWLARIMCHGLHDGQCLAGAIPYCWVVMPDHVHVLLQLKETELSRVVKKLKAWSAQMLNREIGRSGRFWAAGFHDHALRKEENLRNVASYIVANPVRARLVSNVRDYPYWNARWL